MKYIFLIMRFGLMVVQRVFYFLTAGEWPPFASVAVVVQDGEKYLMIKRRDGRGYGLPGGYIKLHESAEEAAIREVKEETGYDIELRGVREILSGKRKKTRVRAVDIIYNAKIIGGEMRNSLEGQCHWVQLDEVRNSMAFDYLKAIEGKQQAQ
ncbi:MAG: NUDIX hydrolase [bacterium]